MLRKLLTLFTISFGLQAYGFVPNYKNLNTLAAIICAQSQFNNSEKTIHKFKIDKSTISPGVSQLELSGTCNAKYNKNKITDIGEELQLTITSKGSIHGNLGVNKIKVQFKSQLPLKLIIQNGLLGTTDKIALSSVKWSQNNMIFNFDQSKNISFSLSPTLKAKESQSNLVFKDKVFYKIWNFESYGCNDAKLTQSECETLAHLF